MQHKLLASICALLFLAALAGCGDDDPALDWGKTVDYDAAVGERVLGTATAALDGTNGRYQETVLGNFIMDGIAEYARFKSGGTVDFALHNGQNLKVFTLSGELNNAAILALLGADKLYICTYTGKQVKDIIEGFVKSTTAGSWNANCAVMVSKEVSYTINTAGGPPEAANIKVNGALVDEGKNYRVALGDFIGNNSNASRFFPVLPDDKKTSYDPTTLAQAVAQYVMAKGTINPSDYPLGRYTGEVPVL
ncbi:MAG: 5'-nucleotidase C-terminal domain-containing protein [Spirochaetota bacterium]|jgi:2',3'-cyclic-nucleotide 2'-phosphodiesterase (5'-nucleotidase family)|nr:5'-nucleotidase C-terminal domain-containing protein [Spirochaetota bacterium]